MILYHATPLSNLTSIIKNGIKPGYEGVVYACEKVNDALKFLFIRGYDDVLMVKFKVDKRKVKETFDHSEAFFKCRCWGCTVPVTPDMIIEYRKHDLRPFRQRLYSLNK